MVCKLLTAIRADKVFFCQKDGQQCLVVKRMNTDLNLGADVVVCPTVREYDGLAMSSRNVNLNADERKAAAVLYRSLSMSRKLYDDGVADTNEIKRQMLELIEQEPLARVDYVSIADGNTLEELCELHQPAMISLAVHIGKTRLIDNIVI